MASRAPVLRPVAGPAKYFFSLNKYSAAAPTTRADISEALLDLLTQSVKQNFSGVADGNDLEEKDDRDGSDSLASDALPARVSNKSKKREARRENKQQLHEPQRAVANPGATLPKPPQRTLYWFEKYIWFLSSDGYLVLTSRYSHQTALLLTRHLKANDVVVSADVPGASLTVVKNYLRNSDVIPPSTLTQASTLALSTSVAWDSNGFAQGWWVRSSAVKVNTNVEEVLTAMSVETNKDENGVDLILMVDVEDKMKNAIGPAPLIMGFGFLFLLDDESAKKYGRSKLLDIPSNFASSEEENGQTEEVSLHDSEGEEDDKDHSDFSANVSDGSDEGFLDDNLQSDSDSESENNDIETAAGSGILKQSEPVTLPRGKKSKLKKIQLKYADQDDEDRALRMTILGSANTASRRREAEQARQMRRQVREAEEQEQRKAQEVAQLKNRDRRKEATEAQRIPVRADVLLVYDDSEKEEIVPREKFTGRPSREDILISAIPICAPWPALHKVKYKVRLLPGVGKRGKTLKKCQEWFMRGMGGQPDKSEIDIDRAWPKEIQLIGALADSDIALPVGVQKFRAAIPAAKSAGGKPPKQSTSKKGGAASSSQKNSKSAKSKRGKKMY
ncbi:uncharacterized protein V2V93DRAFT_367076 [Kockiozyma suomiensis]|uniref:uncharacterized protein n=1 Tax=Kockiozyma suomiensis TaxID=1337062 RepID=UPI003343334D